MSDDIAVQRRSLLTRGPSWAAEWPVDTAPGTLAADLVLATYPTGIIPSGAALGRVTSGEHAGCLAPYGGTTDEEWVFTEGGTGLTSWTFTPDGGTASGSLDDDATAADLQAEADAKYGEGNLIATRTAVGPSVWRLRVNPDGELANTNLTSPTTTPTGGTGTVVVSTAVAGGADGSADGTQVGVGLLAGTRTVRAGFNVDCALYDHGRVYRDLLPADSGADDAFFVDVPSIRTSNVGA